MDNQDIREIVRYKYGKAALKIAAGESSCCSSSSCCAGEPASDPITANLDSESETATLPADAVAASLGCGNPTALAQLNAGEVVLDLGSGGGIDVLLSAKRVGPTGKAYGLDMTDAMLALARENQRKADVGNVEFLKGEIEAIPLPDASVDVIISNCVINLSGDKDRVLSEEFRVLKPADGLPCRTSSCVARCRWRSGAASSCGSAAWPAPSRSRSTATSSPRRASKRSPWSPRVCTAPRTRAS